MIITLFLCCLNFQGLLDRILILNHKNKSTIYNILWSVFINALCWTYYFWKKFLDLLTFGGKYAQESHILTVGNEVWVVLCEGD